MGSVTYHFRSDSMVRYRVQSLQTPVYSRRARQSTTAVSCVGYAAAPEPPNMLRAAVEGRFSARLARSHAVPLITTCENL